MAGSFGLMLWMKVRVVVSIRYLWDVRYMAPLDILKVSK